MAKPRPKTLSKLPPAAKVEKVADDPREYRSRPTLPGPFGDDEPPFLGALPEVLGRAEVDAEAGMAPVIEYRLPGTPWMPWRKPVLIADLARLGLARQAERGWIIDPRGQQMIYDAMEVPGGSQ